MDIPIDVAFSSPSELSRLLRVVERLVAKGLLSSFTPKKARAELITLDSVRIDGPWPDYFECYFTDANGDVYQLAAETYHGIGGSWRRVANPPIGDRAHLACSLCADPTEPNAFRYLKHVSREYIKDTSEIQRDDGLVGSDRFGRDDVSYFAAEVERDLKLSIPQNEWAEVRTFDDMAALLARHLKQLTRS